MLEILENLNEQVGVRIQSQLSTIETNLQKCWKKLSQESSQDELLEIISQQVSSLTERLDNIKQSSSPKEISPPPSPIGLNLSWQEAELAATYNASPDSLLEIAITVSETEASMNQSIQEVVFETNRRGNYWIISQESDNYLIPKQHIKLVSAQ